MLCCVHLSHRLGVGRSHWLQVLFKCIDANQDSRVSFAEYFSFVQPLGVSEDDAKVGFAAIDTDGNGELSQQEVAVACAKYYFSPDDNDHKHFYGKFDKSNESLISAHQRERIARIFKMKSSLHAGDDGKVVLGDFIAWGAAVAKGNSIEFNDARKSEWTMAFNTFFANGAAGESVDAFVENCQTFLKHAGAGTIAEAAKVNIVREVYM
jgi:Ca2+-binding EF-hand superfamily protein